MRKEELVNCADSDLDKTIRCHALDGVEPSVVAGEPFTQV
jgi:hypothetical protein